MYMYMYMYYDMQTATVSMKFNYYTYFKNYIGILIFAVTGWSTSCLTQNTVFKFTTKTKSSQ